MTKQPLTEHAANHLIHTCYNEAAAFTFSNLCITVFRRTGTEAAYLIAVAGFDHCMYMLYDFNEIVTPLELCEEIHRDFADKVSRDRKNWNANVH